MPRHRTLERMAIPSFAPTDDWAALVARQHGAVSRSQVLALGGSRRRIAWALRTGRWVRVHPGVYRTYTGPVTAWTRIWAALLYAGASAIVSHETAAWIDGLIDAPPAVVHITVPTHSRRVRPQPGVVIHLSSHVEARRHPARDIPRPRVEHTTLDLVERAARPDDVVGWLTRAVQRRLTTAARLRVAADGRAKLRHRALVNDILADVEAGARSVLERRFGKDVARAHGLPVPARNAREVVAGRTVYRDVAGLGVIVELDGRAAHPLEDLESDRLRDNDAAVESGRLTLRFGWRSVAGDPCRAAAQYGAALRRQGHDHPIRRCGPGCTAARWKGRQPPSVS